MKKLILLMGLIGLIARATPQTSDSDLKAAQASPVIGYNEAITIPDYGKLALQGTIQYVHADHNGPDCTWDATGITGFANGPRGFAELELYDGTMLNGDFSPGISAVNSSGANCAIELFILGLTGTFVVPCAPGQEIALYLVGDNPGLTGIDFSAAAIALSPAVYTPDGAGLFFGFNSHLTTITAGDGISTGIVTWNGQVVLFRNCALDQANEDNFLEMCVAAETNAPGQMGGIDISGGANAVPDGVGAGYLAILVGTGWTVTTN